MSPTCRRHSQQGRDRLLSSSRGRSSSRRRHHGRCERLARGASSSGRRCHSHLSSGNKHCSLSLSRGRNHDSHEHLARGALSIGHDRSLSLLRGRPYDHSVSSSRERHHDSGKCLARGCRRAGAVVTATCCGAAYVAQFHRQGGTITIPMSVWLGGIR